LNKQKLFWVDLEMTGLEPDDNRIIEVAAIVTDSDFNELETYHSIVKQPTEVVEAMESWSKAKHQQSGLTGKIPDGAEPQKVEQDLVALIKRHFKDPAILAGNSVHHDRRFIRRYWPQLESLLHYRMLDVSAWKVVMEAKFSHQFKKAKTHRAEDDIRESIAELKDYIEFLQTGKS